MDDLHRHRSFADSRSHPIYRNVPHIANGKNAGNIGFEQERVVVERPSLRALPVTYTVKTSQQQTALVPFDHIRQPIRPRQCPNKDEHRTRRHALNLVGIGTKHRTMYDGK